MITQVNINTSEELIRQFNILENHFIYRGHANSDWGLESTLERTLGNAWTKDKASKYEDHYLKIFKSNFHLYNQVEHKPKSKLSWLSIMQHYGIPTRLLDFTESPYVALYFALEAYNPQEKEDLAVYAIDYSSVMEATLDYIKSKDNTFKTNKDEIDGRKDKIFDEIIDRFSYPILWVTEPQELNARIDRQAGTFLLSGDKEKQIEEIISSQVYGSCESIKFVISNQMYENLFALLRKMNINGKSIYGDLGGLSKYIKMEMQVYATDK